MKPALAYALGAWMLGVAVGACIVLVAGKTSDSRKPPGESWPSAHSAQSDQASSDRAAKLREAADISDLKTASERIAPSFWNTDPHSASVLRSICVRMRQTSEFAACISEVETFVAKHADRANRSLLQAQGYAGCLSIPPSVDEIAPVIRKLSWEDAALLLRQVALANPKASAEQIHDELSAVWKAAYGDLSDAGRNQIAEITVQSRSLTNVEDALAFVQARTSGKVRDALLREVLGIAYSMDADALEKLLPRFAKDYPDATAAMLVARGADLAQLRQVNDRLPVNARGKWVDQLFKNVRSQRPADVQAFLDVFPADEVTPANRTEIANGWFAEQPQQIVTWLSKLEPPARKKIVEQSMFIHWGTMADRTQASRVYLQQLDGGNVGELQVLSNAIFAVARNDFNLAKEAVDRLPAAIKAQAAGFLYRAEARELARHNLESLPVFLERIPATARSSVLADALGTLPAEGFRDNLERCRLLDDPALRETAEIAVLTSSRKAMPSAELEKAVIERAASSSNPGRYAPLIEHILSTKAEWDTNSAVAFVGGLKQESLQHVAVPLLARNWAALDPYAASEWAASLPEGRSRDLASKEVAISARDDPSRALECANGIGDAKLRMEAAQKVVSSWAAIDRDFARNLIQESQLAPAEQTQLMELTRKQP